MSRLRAIYRFDYMGHKKWYLAISCTIIAIGLIALFVRGSGNPIDGLKFGLEFETGTRVVVAFVDPTDTGKVSAVAAAQGYPSAVVQQVKTSGAANKFQIQVPPLTQAQNSDLKAALDEAFTIAQSADGSPDYSFSTVGPTFGKQVISASWKAIAIALILILIYITLRFEFKYAVGAVAAEVHDLLVVVCIYSLLGREITTGTIAAVLTILGYSLYDTVIVFDRIRENAPKMSRSSYGDMVNRSIWETLTRSINTTMLTLIPVLCLLLFGGATLKDFAFALLVGILSGAYSSIFVASPVLTVLKEREPQYRRLAARAAGE
jgi:SecD/SecF fusion protein